MSCWPNTHQQQEQEGHNSRSVDDGALVHCCVVLFKSDTISGVMGHSRDLWVVPEYVTV